MPGKYGRDIAYVSCVMTILKHLMENNGSGGISSATPTPAPITLV